jgi:hypothetical protein
MRRPILLVVVAIVVAAAQPATAVDDGFQGRYRVIAQHLSGNCFGDSYTHRVEVRYISPTIRQFGFSPSDLVRHFKYVNGRWRHTRGWRFVLDYDPATDTAVGVRGPGPEGCTWDVRIIPIG